VQIHDVLMAIAQVAATFAGFTGIVVVFGRRGQGAWHRFVIKFILLASLGVLFFSFVPDVVAAAHIGDTASWRIAMGLFASYHVAVVGWSIVGEQRARTSPDFEQRLPRSRVPLFAVGLAIILFQFAVAAGLASELLPFAYLLALLWILGMCTIVFGVLLLEGSEPAA